MNNHWNKTTVATLVGLVLLFFVAISFYFLGNLPAKPIYNYALIGVAAGIVLVAIIYVILVSQGKIKNAEPDYRQFFIMGILWFVIGLPQKNLSLIAIGLIFMVTGLVHKKRWKEQTKWNDLPPAKKKIKLALIIILGLLVLATFVIWYLAEQKKSVVTNFEECAAAGNSVMESYPRQCRAAGKTFTEIIPVGSDKILVGSPLPGALVKSPLKITGQARGTWYFEASFPIKLFDDQGRLLIAVPAQAQGDWMTEEFVPFEATLEFTAPQSETGKLVLEKDNPSGLPENADSISFPVRFK